MKGQEENHKKKEVSPPSFFIFDASLGFSNFSLGLFFLLFHWICVLSTF
jgi:hypothetical protein